MPLWLQDNGYETFLYLSRMRVLREIVARAAAAQWPRVVDVVLTTYTTMGTMLLIDLEQTQPYFTTSGHCWLDLADFQAIVEALARLHSASLMGSPVKESPKT
uniref:Uncharacterized protein n=1 Tax=Trichogramma kaykai TaxID=54128 RepID=A0ABD2VX84_9HYME